MAVLDYSASHKSTSFLGAFFKRLGTSIYAGFESMAHARARTAEFQYYNDMSDEQLAAKGLRRDEIARYVFRDMLI